MSTTSYPDQDHERSLIAAAQSGDVSARNHLILACLPHLRQTVAVYAPSARGEEFEELYHQAIAALYESLDAYDLSHPKRARLYVFAYSRIRHTVSRHFRSKAQVELTEDLPDLVAEPPEQVVHAAQTVAMVRQALAELSPQESQVLYARRALDQAPTRAALARQYGCSQQWIDRIERRAACKFAAAMARARRIPLASQ